MISGLSRKIEQSLNPLEARSKDKEWVEKINDNELKSLISRNITKTRIESTSDLSYIMKDSKLT